MKKYLDLRVYHIYESLSTYSLFACNFLSDICNLSDPTARPLKILFGQIRAGDAFGSVMYVPDPLKPLTHC